MTCHAEHVGLLEQPIADEGEEGDDEVVVTEVFDETTEM
eukprot:CAMPEP_0175890000 /NCGR_PEP_ID=MMETSP0107_2-20121207/47579_1 /TAXON_ID=195067 ORGANISM="Goniomonas pacifica, Strain CCMP1869" /NCGR_SAMPLE_ID=MMETSP0107_2 /ASSEMBLY_ACC=CAM_ASM_000203 /LENGTH=38 /DNA_ID= /DNA_START= /DNA_END= /DNA_ORIENTATION=